MMGLRGALLVASAAAGIGLTGCPDDGGHAGGGDATTTTEIGTEAGTSGAETTASADGASTTPLGMSETGMMELGPCEDPQVIPPPPVDCSGADGVLTQSVLIEDGGDDPSILEGVVRVEGAIRINRTSLTNLDFMACVQEVTADVTIFGNEQLTDVQGLWSLGELGTDFIFSQNHAIEVFDGLPNLGVIPGNLVMRENAGLRRIDGFHRLEGVVGLGMDEYGNTIGGNITIQENPVLERIDGLLGLRAYGGVFAVANHPRLCLSSMFAVIECIELPTEPGWCRVGCGDSRC